MAFEEILTTQIEAGDPVTQELFRKIKNSLDDHEDRLAVAEAAVQSFYPIVFKAQGALSLYAPLTGIVHERVPSNLRLTSARILVIDAGSAGTVEFDVQYKRGGAAFASIFSTRPSVAYTAGSYALSSNAVLAVTSLEIGDILRLDAVQGQTDNYESHLILGYEADE